ncbi:MAG TPA: helix-turn-helix transcriptional regulator [Myxococcales bacterium]|jgi:transcriptional regulator with XRE-family HTH domain|nr:helix-turn-helix transcriptional regulator [Myxococcales bacterium]
MKRPVAFQVGERIKQLRLHSRGGKLTQETLAERADISVSFLSMIERGERSAHIDTLASLADALGVSLDELFRDRSRLSDSVDPALRPLIDFAERHRLNRRDVDRLLSVAKALFEN